MALLSSRFRGGEPTTLSARVRLLRAEVDPDIRRELGQLVAALDKANASVAVVDTMNRLGLKLVRMIYVAAGRPRPESDNLYQNLVAVGPFDAKGRPRDPEDVLIPKTVDAWWHPIRILSNQAGHAIEGNELVVDANVARLALDAYLAILQWYYCTNPYGPKLPQGIYLRERSPLIRGGMITGGLALIALASAMAARGMPNSAAEEFAPARVAARKKTRLSLLKERVGDVQRQFPAANPEKRAELSQTMQETILEAEQLGANQYAAYWRALKRSQESLFDGSDRDPFPALYEATLDLSHAMKLSAEDPELQGYVIETAEHIRYIVNNKWKSHACSPTLKKRILASLLPILKKNR